MLFPQRVSNLKLSNTTHGEIVTASGTAHTKGSWTQLLTATAFDAYWLEAKVTATQVINTDCSSLLDIGIDAAGGTSYTVVVPDVLVGQAGNINSYNSDFTIPVYIPAGSTVAARMQSAIISQTAVVGVALYGGVGDDPFPMQSHVVAYGVNTGDSGGVVCVNASIHVKSAWVEIISATTHPHRGVMAMMSLNTDTKTGGPALIADIGIGAGGSEVVLIADVYWETGGTEIIGNKTPHGEILTPVPEGSRLAIRTQTSTNNTGDEHDMALYGWG